MSDALRHLDQRFKTLKPLTLMVRPPKGWVRAIRDALGMTAQQLAERMGVARPRISELEKAELTGQVTMQSLDRAAQAMGCRLVYAIVPEKSLRALVEEQKKRVLKEGREELAAVKHTMLLENQTVEDSRRHEKRIVTELLRDPKQLWKKI